MTVTDVIIKHVSGRGHVPALPTKGLQSVCVIGATVGGLQTLGQFGRVGIPCKIYDKALRIGGVWGTPHIGATCPAPTELYQLPELPCMKGVEYGEVGGSDHVLQYLRDYIFHRKIAQNIFLGTTVEQIERRTGPGDWEVTLKKPDGTLKKEVHDLIVIATQDHEKPIKPDFLANTDFQGKHFHSSEVTDAGKLVNKNVVIWGDNRAAYEIASAAGIFAKTITIASSNPPWFYPTNFLKLPVLPIRHFFTSRGAFHAVGPEYYLRRQKFNPFAPLSRFLLWFLSNLTLLTPRSMWNAKYSQSQHIDSNFLQRIRKGKIRHVRSDVQGLTENQVVCADGTKLDCDVFVYATGFEKEKWVPPTDGLYRGIMDPERKGIAYIGYTDNQLNYPLTCYVQAAWLRHLFFGKMRVPSQEEMDADIQYCKQFDFKDGLWDFRIIGYHDQLITDMGAPTHYKPDFLREYLQAYTARDYGAFKLLPRKRMHLKKTPEGWKIQWGNILQEFSKEKSIFYIPGKVNV